MKPFSLIILTLLTSLCLHAFDVEGIDPDESVVYKTIGETELKLHIFNPEGHKASDERPAIIFFFGGGWVAGSPSQFFAQCDYLQRSSPWLLQYRTRLLPGTLARHGSLPGVTGLSGSFEVS